MRIWKPIIPAFIAVLSAAGCFKEPKSARDTVPPESRVWLKEQCIRTLTTDAVLNQGLIFLKDGTWTNLSSRIAKLEPSKIEYLNLDYNAMTNADAVSEFTGLKWLRLNNNRLTALPNLSQMKKLRRLHLRDNALGKIPDTLKDLPSLDTVDFSGNPISEIPDWFAKKEGLLHLSFSGTRITKLPENLSAWKSLRSLQLGGLKIESLEEMKRIRAALPDTTIVF